ncbi:ArsR/SmtB family transcription factor [Salsipaludibacter albus]|uniref:ArsR/SmtB family transcription factor n=1 Tax=Salsipaludibacter albus TaxID=2849650 RepID=UPI001EE41500|nr:DUF5937 family protein [Salsipaludibacter albus]MBY5162478.1 metalloregulator ArsR/SmtB family transcription factor [Salsipaludibacter albus]
MAVTVRLDGTSSLVLPTLSPLAELGAALHVLTRLDHHLFLADWRTRVLGRLPGPLDRERVALEFLWDGYRANFLLVVSDALPPVRTLDDELAALAAVPTEQLTTEALQPLGTRLGENLSPGHRPGEGPDQLLSHARARGPAVEDVARGLLEDPARVQRRLVDFLAGCRDAFFGEEWAGLRPTLARSVDEATRLLEARGPTALLAGLGHGVRASDDDVVIDKSFTATMAPSPDQPLHLVPSLLCHPHVIAQPNPRWPLCLQYPVHRRAPTGGLPPLEVTAARLEALADPTRLRLAALLANEARSTRELAGLTGLTEPTVSRHLTVLREAGLVEVRQQGHFRLHDLDLDVVGDLGHALRASLLR